MKLIVGLGNPGKEYERTRHNAGFLAVRMFHTTHIEGFDGWKGKMNAEISEGRLGSEKVILMLPQTYMNRSDDAVIQAVDFWKVDPADIVMVYDDLDLPLGTIRVRAGGASGGHKGVASILGRLATDSIPRIRIGIGSERAVQVPAEDYVLERFSGDEMSALESALSAADEALDMLLTEGVEAAMNRFN